MHGLRAGDDDLEAAPAAHDGPHERAAVQVRSVRKGVQRGAEIAAPSGHPHGGEEPQVLLLRQGLRSQA